MFSRSKVLVSNILFVGSEKAVFDTSPPGLLIVSILIEVLLLQVLLLFFVAISLLGIFKGVARNKLSFPSRVESFCIILEFTSCIVSPFQETNGI